MPSCTEILQQSYILLCKQFPKELQENGQEEMVSSRSLVIFVDGSNLKSDTWWFSAWKHRSSSSPGVTHILFQTPAIALTRSLQRVHVLLPLRSRFLSFETWTPSHRVTQSLRAQSFLKVTDFKSERARLFTEKTSTPVFSSLLLFSGLNHYLSDFELYYSI